MVFPEADFDNAAFGFSDGQYTFTHSALGADMFRYSWNFGLNWTAWTNWEDMTTIDASVFDNSANWWEGQHIIVQCMYIFYIQLSISFPTSAQQIGVKRRYPPPPSFTQTETTIPRERFRSSSPVAPSTSGVSTRESPPRWLTLVTTNGSWKYLLVGPLIYSSTSSDTTTTFMATLMGTAFWIGSRPTPPHRTTSTCRHLRTLIWPGHLSSMIGQCNGH